MSFMPDALRMPWNRVYEKSGPGTSMLYPKSDNSWYSRDPNGVDTLVGGPALGTPVAFTPTWTSTGTQPAIGNGTLTGRYIKIGKQVDFHFAFAAGSTTTFGTGTYRWSFPVPSFAYAAATGLGGWAYAEDLGVNGYQPLPRFVSTTTFELVYHSVALAGSVHAAIGATTPFTWASGDYMRGSVSYEAA